MTRHPDGDSKRSGSSDQNLRMDLGQFAAGFGVAILLYLAVAVGIGALSIWVLYTIIWRGVRRGLREYYGGQLDAARTVDQIRRSPGPRDW